MRREQNEAVGGRHLELVEVRRTATGRRFYSRANRLSRFGVVVRKERTTTRISDHHDTLEAQFLAQEADSRREIEEQILVDHRRVVVEITSILRKRRKARRDPERNRIVLREIGPGMCHDDSAAGLTARRLVENTA